MEKKRNPPHKKKIVVDRLKDNPTLFSKLTRSKLSAKEQIIRVGDSEGKADEKNKKS